MPVSYGCPPPGTIDDYRYAGFALTDVSPYWENDPEVLEGTTGPGRLFPYHVDPDTVPPGYIYWCSLSELETVGFLNSDRFDAILITTVSGGYALNPLTSSAISNINDYATGNVCIITSDMMDVMPPVSAPQTFGVYTNGILWACNNGIFADFAAVGTMLTSANYISFESPPTLARVSGDAVDLVIREDTDIPEGRTLYLDSAAYHPIKIGSTTADEWELEEAGMEFFVLIENVPASWIVAETSGPPGWSAGPWPVVIANPYGLAEDGETETECRPNVTSNISAVLEEARVTATITISAFLSPATSLEHDIDAILLEENEFQIYYINKDQNNFAYVAQYITDIQDLESVNWKHIKLISAIGDYGTNSIKLAWTKTPDYSTWSDYYTKVPTVPGTDQATNWYNLGQGRRFAFDVVFEGNSNIEHNAIEVLYNIRTK